MNEENESIQLRAYAGAGAQLIYLPGIHGDWTVVRGFRQALRERVRFVEFTYPRSLTWSLDDYAAGVERELAAKGITSGWLLGESFSSQVVWALVGRGNFKVEGIILAGGFVRHPLMWGVGLAQFLMPRIPMSLLRLAKRFYRSVSRLRYKNSPVGLETIDAFLARRTKLDWQAMTHRLQLIRENDPRSIVRQTQVRVYALTGLVDPIVPWLGVKGWLRRQCPGFRGSRMILAADHVVLGTAPAAAVEQVLQWMAAPDA